MSRVEDRKNSLEFHAISLEDQIGTAIRTALTETEQDTQPKFNDNLLVEVLLPFHQVSRAVVYHVGFEGDMAYAYEDVINESIAAFAGHAVEERNLSLLTQVIKSVVEPFVSNRNDYYDFTIEEDDGDGSENIDQIADTSGPQDTGMRARKRQINITDSITSTSNNNSSQASEAGDVDEDQEDQDRVNEWMEKVMAKSEAEYLQEEAEYSDVAPDEEASGVHIHKSPLRSDKEASSSASDSENDGEQEQVNKSSASRSFERPLYHLTSSDDDTLHSEDSIERHKTSKEQHFQSPAPYQIRKSAAAIYEAAEEEKEPLPAWLMPKSPLDAHFRKGYGGLGKEDLQETIELITSTQKKALRASRIADDNEESSVASEAEDETSSSEEDREEEGGDHTDAGEIDEPVPAWLIPKSPLDAHFRKGYGGLGKEDLQDAIEEITTAQKLARKHIQASQRAEDEFDVLNAITVDDLPNNFGADTAVGTPTQVRPTRRLGSSESKNGSGGNHARGTEYAKQQKLFQSPKPSRIPVSVSSAKKSARKNDSEEPLPAWLIPKSPLDAHFRKGYGGLGHEDLTEAIAEITSSQKKAQRATIASLAQDQSTKSIMKMLENYYDTRDSKTVKNSATKKPVAGKGKKRSAKKGENAVGETSESIMFDAEGAEEGKFSYIDALAQLADMDAEDLLPSAHPSTSPPSTLTNNPSLNAMMRDSFNTFVSKYAKPSTQAAQSESKTSRAATPQSNKKKVFANVPAVTSDAKPSTKIALNEEDFAAYLRSPELKHNFDEIDALIRESQKNLRRMKLGEKKAKKTRSSSFVSAVSLTDHESQEGRPKSRKVPRAKLTKRADAYAVPVSKPAKPVKTSNAKAQKQATAKLHEQVTGNVRRGSVASIVTVPISWSRRSSVTTMASKISQSLLNEGPVRLPSPSPRLIRSPSPAINKRPQSKPRARTPPATSSAPVPAQRLLSVNSRLLVPTAAALIRSADIATNSSKAANIHNEWPTQLRSENAYGESDVELSGRKLRNKLLRRSLPAVSAEQIIEWSSPDKKSKSVDFLYGLRGARSAEEAAYLSSPAATPVRRRSSTPTHIAALPASSRLTVPTVTSVMRSLVTAQQSPVIRRLEKSVQNKPSKTYLLHGEKLAQKLNQAQEKSAKKRRVKKRKASVPRA